jgi:hypothetical protein
VRPRVVPQASNFNQLAQGEGETVPLRRKGYFRYRPHLLRTAKPIHRLLSAFGPKRTTVDFGRD